MSYSDMSFLEAVGLISHREDLWLCSDPEELDGRHPSICVYCDDMDVGQGGGLVGKLRWPKDGKPAHVDVELAEYLRTPVVT